MRQKVEYRTASRENYNKFCAEHPHINIDFKKWREILYTYNEMYVKYVLETGVAIKLPRGFGKLTINKQKQKVSVKYKDQTFIKLPIDWKRTKEQGKYIYHLNHHTHGYRFRWKWFGSSALFYQADVWNFKPSRVVSRLLSKYLKDPNKSYSEVYVEWTYRKQFK